MSDDLLQKTLGRATRDQKTSEFTGRVEDGPLAGLRYRRSKTRTDDRGSLCEMFDSRWGWPEDPLVYAYFVTLLPGVAKGWALHREHEDRYFIIRGEVELVLFDVRRKSPTSGEIAKLRLSEKDRRLVCIPSEVWHASLNVGSEEAYFANFPTAEYDHANPDKYRLPLDTPLIPYSFAGVPGW